MSKTKHGIGKDPKTGIWYSASGSVVPQCRLTGEPYGIWIELGEQIPEPCYIESVGSENIYFRGVSGLSYFCKCL